MELRLKRAFSILPLVVGILTSEEMEKEERLDGAESQNYGYGYGTKVDTPTGSSTVYVHGFGTDDSYHAPYGHGHIDPYLNHKQGYGYTAGPGYGYNGVAAYPGHGHHGHGPHHGAAHGPAYGAGYGAPQPFVGTGFRYGHGYGYGYGHISSHH